MKGIILKDLYDNFCIPKNAAAHIFAGLITIPVGFLVRSEYYYILFSMIILPLFGGCALEYPTEQEERAHFTKLLATFPVSGAQIVTAKYILGLCYAAVCNLLALMCAMAQVYVHHTVSLSEALRIWGIGISISLIFLSLIYVGYFLLGRRWGTVFFIGVTILIAAVYGASTVLVGVEAVFSLSPVLIVCLLLAGAVMLALSRFASVMIYKWKIS